MFGLAVVTEAHHSQDLLQFAFSSFPNCQVYELGLFDSDVASCCMSYMSMNILQIDIKILRTRTFDVLHGKHFLSNFLPANKH